MYNLLQPVSRVTTICLSVHLHVRLSLRLYVHEQLSPSVMTAHTCMQGVVKAGRDFLYSSQPSAYAKRPWKTVNYADCHDGQTLFDQVISQTLKVYGLHYMLAAVTPKLGWSGVHPCGLATLHKQ